MSRSRARSMSRRRGRVAKCSCSGGRDAGCRPVGRTDQNSREAGQSGRSLETLEAYSETVAVRAVPESTNIWSLVTATGTPSASATPAHMFEFLTRLGTGATSIEREIITCQVGVGWLWTPGRLTGIDDGAARRPRAPHRSRGRGICQHPRQQPLRAIAPRCPRRATGCNRVAPSYLAGVRP